VPRHNNSSLILPHHPRQGPSPFTYIICRLEIYVALITTASFFLWVSPRSEHGCFSRDKKGGSGWPVDERGHARIGSQGCQSTDEEYDKWNYRSVIGTMNYLAMNTRPEIAFAVHQCAKFCNNPKLLHEKAVKHIGQYLAGTANQGIILNPDSSGKLDAYVDSDFAGRWHQKFAELRESVLSRTGFVITYCNCPVTWSSKLQTEIALSTTEAEYIALSTMCRTLLPMRMLLKEINKHTVHKLQIDDSRLSTNLMNSTGEGKLIVSEVFEDNSGCVVLANDDQYTLAHMPRKMKIYM